MNCPACEKPLVVQQLGAITLDVCTKGCHGIWFDAHELKKLDEPHEPEGKVMLQGERVAPANKNKKYNCPKCKNIVMLRRFASVKRQVEVDECGKCAGIWLDTGELEQIRSEFKTEGERVKAADACFNEMFGVQMADQKSKSQDELRKLQRIANAFRFICPSYYIPGKQKGGAF